jgi:hypothetical protein
LQAKERILQAIKANQAKKQENLQRISEQILKLQKELKTLQD